MAFGTVPFSYSPHEEFATRPFAPPAAREVADTVDVQQGQEEHWTTGAVPVLVFHNGRKYVPRYAVHKPFPQASQLGERLPNLFRQRRDDLGLCRRGNLIPFSIPFPEAQAQELGQAVPRLECDILPIWIGAMPQRLLFRRRVSAWTRGSGQIKTKIEWAREGRALRKGASAIELMTVPHPLYHFDDTIAKRK
jgi:hypothetical protein